MSQRRSGGEGGLTNIKDDVLNIAFGVVVWVQVVYM